MTLLSKEGEEEEKEKEERGRKGKKVEVEKEKSFSVRLCNNIIRYILFYKNYKIEKILV